MFTRNFLYIRIFVFSTPEFMQIICSLKVKLCRLKDSARPGLLLTLDYKLIRQKGTIAIPATKKDREDVFLFEIMVAAVPEAFENFY